MSDYTDIDKGDSVRIDGTEHVVVGVNRTDRPTEPGVIVCFGVSEDGTLPASTLIPKEDSSGVLVAPDGSASNVDSVSYD